MRKAFRYLISLVVIAKGLKSNIITRIRIRQSTGKYQKSIVNQRLPNGPILYIPNYSVINDPGLLMLLKRACYTRKDLRAGWIGEGLPHTDLAEFKPLAKWATEHWAMYTGFLSYISKKDKGGQILDVGCGLGYATACLARILDSFIITGIDNDDIAIKFAKRFNTGNNVNYVQSNFSLYRASQRYEYIFALEILEHIKAENHYKFIEKCLSLLAKNGLLFITTPNALDEKDSKYFHVGLLNRARAQSFIEAYKGRIINVSFYDNQELSSADPSRFEINDSFNMFEDTGRNRSHFRFVMK